MSVPLNSDEHFQFQIDRLIETVNLQAEQIKTLQYEIHRLTSRLNVNGVYGHVGGGPL